MKKSTNQVSFYFTDQAGTINTLPLLIIVAAVGIISFLLISSTVPLNGLFGVLNPRSSSHASSQPTGQRLRTLAGNFLIGYASASGFNSLPDAATYKAVASSEFNILTPENDMKWGTIEPQQGVFNFGPGDSHVAFAQANGMKVHGHNLAWGSSNPGWLTGGSWTASTLTQVLYNHIDNVVGHYKGQVAIWDVVNEPINTANIWQNIIGPSYIDLALRRAHAADPAACLIINEYSDETLGGAGDALYNMAKGLVQSGSPLCGVGFQMHLVFGPTDLNSFTANMQRFADLGLQIYITEMDVSLPQPPSASDLDYQANEYQGVLDRCLLQPACKGLQMWGFTDKYSWIPGVFSGKGSALIFDDNYNPKSAYYAIQSRLGGSISSPTPIPSVSPVPTPTPIPTPTPAPCSTCAAVFLGQDTTTQGTWKGKYGADGYSLQGDGQSIPSYATLSVSNAQLFTWASSTTDLRGLQKVGSSTDRVAATWYNNPFTIDVNLTDGLDHNVSLYSVDWDNQGRVQTITVVDPTTGAILDTRNESNFSNSSYLTWRVHGHVQFRLTATVINAVVSAIFFDPLIGSTPTPSPSPVTCPKGSIGDIDCDGKISIFDYSTLIGNYGKTVPAGTQGDLNNSGKVDLFDYSTLVSNYGK